MSQEKAQLIAPQGHFTVPGLNVAGVVTASSFSGNCTGTASSLTQGSNVVVGVMTASSFAGDVFGNAAGLSTTTAGLKLGIVTSTSFAGNFTGIGSGLTGTPNIVAGLVTASQFVGNTPGLAAGLSAGKNLAAGIITATTFHGDGSGLTGAGSTAYIRQTVTASVSAAINLNLGNVIYFVHDANATVSFANTTTATDITIIRTLTDNTITWPSGITWNGGSDPTLVGSNSRATAGQVFNLVTYNGGTNWYGYEEVDADPQTTALFVVGGDPGNRGNLGLNATTHRSSPTQLPGSNWNTPRGGGGIASKTDGTLWMWGYNGYGALGQNNKTSYSSPVQIPGTWTLSQLNYDASGYYMSGAVRGDGTLWMWGDNNYNDGALGQNNQTEYSSPVQVIGSWNSGVQEFRIGDGYYDHSMARNSSNELWCWGNADMGQLGQNDKTKRSSPVQVPGEYKSISAAYRRSGAVKTNGELWVWGNNQNGTLGLNNETQYSSPKQIPGTSWASIHFGGGQNGNGWALRTDGTLWAWGSNHSGQLGQNSSSTPRVSSPVQIPGTTWSQITPGNQFAAFQKTDGTIWVLGDNSEGALGLNQAVALELSSPTQVPGSWVSGSLKDGRTDTNWAALKESDS